jgi:hypothetical protein
MANPNLLTLSTVEAKLATASLGTSSATILSNSTSGMTFKVNTITVANTDGSNSSDVTIGINDGSNTRYIAYQVTVPPKATVVISSRETSYYLNQNYSLVAQRSISPTGTSDIIVSYEEIS